MLDRLTRLKKLHARALGLYMAFRMNGKDGEVQLRRLRRIEQEITNTNYTNQTN